MKLHQAHNVCRSAVGRIVKQCVYAHHRTRNLTERFMWIFLTTNLFIFEECTTNQVSCCKYAQNEKDLYVVDVYVFMLISVRCMPTFAAFIREKHWVKGAIGMLLRCKPMLIACQRDASKRAKSMHYGWNSLFLANLTPVLHPVCLSFFSRLIVSMCRFLGDNW